MPYKIEGWTVYPKKNELVKEPQVVRIETKAMQVLSFLIENAGNIVSREELMQKVWADVYVTEDTLTRCISILRKTFEDNSTNSRIIQTIKGQGYRVIVPVEFYDSEDGFGKGSKKISVSQSSIFISCFLLVTTLIFAIIFLTKKNNIPYSWTKIPIASSKLDEMFPSISPDGSRIAYSVYSDSLTKYDIYIKMANESGKAIKITNSSGSEISPTWSADGLYLAYNKIDEDNYGIYKISSLGGVPQKIGTPYTYVGQSLAWSNDGSKIAYSDREFPKDSYSIYLMDVNTGEKIKLTEPTNQHWGDYDPSFSPDDQRISFVRAISAGTHDIFVYDFTSKKSNRLTFQTRRTAGQTWNKNNNTIIYAHEEGNSSSLWSIPSEGGTPTRLNLSGIRPSIDDDGKNLVVENWIHDFDIFSIDLVPTLLKKEFSSAINSTYEDFDPVESPNGKQIAFISNRSGTYQLWLYNKNNNEVSMITNSNDFTYINTPSWSNDGSKIAFTSFTKKGNADIYIIDLTTNNLDQLTTSRFNEISPKWSSNDQRIYFGSNKSSEWQIWYKDLSNKDQVQVTQNGGYSPILAKHNNDIYYSKFDQKGIWKFSQNDKIEEPVLSDLHLYDWANFDLDKKRGIYYISRESASSPTFLKYYLNNESKTIMKSGFSRRTKITLSKDCSILYGAQILNQNIDILLYKGFN